MEARRPMTYLTAGVETGTCMSQGQGSMSTTSTRGLWGLTDSYDGSGVSRGGTVWNTLCPEGYKES
jgi:hypothetical protein